MTFQSNLRDLTPKERQDYGFARARDLAFDAVRALWRRRQEQGMTQGDIVRALGWERARVSRSLSGPGNWTMRTLGAFVEALHGELEIKVRAVEDPQDAPRNYSAYDGYDPAGGSRSSAPEGSSQAIGKPAPMGRAGGQIVGQ